MSSHYTPRTEELDISLSRSLASLISLLVIIPMIGLFIGGIAELTVMGIQTLA